MDKYLDLFSYVFISLGVILCAYLFTRFISKHYKGVVKGSSNMKIIESMKLDNGKLTLFKYNKYYYLFFSNNAVAYLVDKYESIEDLEAIKTRASFEDLMNEEIAKEDPIATKLIELKNKINAYKEQKERR